MAEPRPTSDASPPTVPPLPMWVAPALLDEQQCVAGDRMCVGCGYNLRTLHATASCPECNEPVANALRLRSLYAAPHEWLTLLVFGSAALTIAWASGASVVVISGVLGISEVVGGASPGSLSNIGPGLIIVTGVIGSVLALIGASAMTARRDNADDDPNARRRRKTTRWLLLVTTVSPLIAISFGRVLEILILPFVLAPFVSLLMLNFLLPWHVANLLRQAGDDRGVKRAEWTGPIAFALLTLGVVLLFVTGEVAPEGVLVCGLCTVVALVGGMASHAACYGRLWVAARDATGDRDYTKPREPHHG